MSHASTLVGPDAQPGDAALYRGKVALVCLFVSEAHMFGVLIIAYLTYLEGSASGQTVGKKAMGIRVVDFQTGGPIGYPRAFIRWIGRYVSAIACLLGYFWMLWDREKQTWHDKFANDVVVPESAYPVESWPG